MHPVSPPGGGSSKADAKPPVFDTLDFTLLHCNVNGFTQKRRGELHAHLASLNYPTFVALNETKLDQSTESLTLDNYVLVSRRDRQEGQRPTKTRHGGGVALFARTDCASTVVLLEHSGTHERSWHLVHTALGPLLLCVWYRPPKQGETSSVDTLEEEWLRHCTSAVGTVIVGDLNVHSQRWLTHSAAATTPEGSALCSFCDAYAFEEKVAQPTRGAHLLDLVLTDLGKEVRCEVQPKLADHALVLVKVHAPVPKEVQVERELWLFDKCNWKALNSELQDTTWNQVLFGRDSATGPFTAEDVDHATENLTEHLLHTLRKHVPTVTKSVTKSTHPWIDERCRKLVERKRAAEGTEDHADRLRECSEGLLEAYKKWVKDTKEKLLELPRASKRWWKLARSLAQKAEKNSSVPPLKRLDGTWATAAEDKAELFLTTFCAKYRLPQKAQNDFTELNPPAANCTADFLVVRTKHAEKVLQELNEDKATGPDALSAKVLKRCSRALALPVAKLARAVLDAGRWPKLWRTHWVFPLYKKKSVYRADNYRGIHLTAQLSKAMERLVGRCFLPFLDTTGVYGPDQFAYRKERGCKDALALNTLQWLWWLQQGRKVGLYNADVSGAFDRVSSERLLQKLHNHGVRGKLLKLLASWLEDREAVVVVDGKCSAKRLLQNMVFQGTVWGPPLWNVYFNDARRPVEEAGFCSTFFADDLSCYKDYAKELRTPAVKTNLEECQRKLHQWGAANQVTFDASKETLHVLHRTEPDGEDFKTLGVLWDTQLLLDKQCREVAQRAGWKLRALLRTLPFHDTPAVVRQYKSQVLPTLEFCTPAVYHCTDTVLEQVDRVQRRFLREAGLTEAEALVNFNLAPLQTRRDIAMLGLLHRTVLGRGPPQFQQWFFPGTQQKHGYGTRLQENRHTKQLHNYLEGKYTELLRRSALGLTRVYNQLPQNAVDKPSVQAFQQWLQNHVKDQACAGQEDWANSLNVRRRSWKQTTGKG